MNGKIKQKGIFRVALYFNEQELTSLAKEAEKLGFRRVGIPIKKQKPNGFANEWLANTDGIGLLVKFTYKYYIEHEAERLTKAAELATREKALMEEKKRLGVI